ncbi:hypothetical protein HK096_000085, partial [Nowakowskiella sp. JEL0078]
MGPLSVYLGLQVKISNTILTIDQCVYIEKMLDCFGMKNSKPVDSPWVESVEAYSPLIEGEEIK